MTGPSRARAILLPLMFLVGGCGSDTVLDKPGVSGEQARADRHRCEQVAANGRIQSQSAPEQAQQQQMETDDCLARLGYKPVPKP